MDLISALATARVDGCLHLSGLGLSAVPLVAIASLAATLRRLDLSDNNLSIIPSELGAFHALEELFLHGNAELTSLPAALESCVSLRLLDVRGTGLSTLPHELSRLPALVDVALDCETNKTLEPLLVAAIQRGGTLALMSVLARRDARAVALDTLRRRLCLDVWPEASDTAAGRARVEELIGEIDSAYPDDRDVRFVAANASRLFGNELSKADVLIAATRFKELRDDTERKALGSEMELTLRAIYYDKADPRAVTRLREVLASLLPALDDVRFFLRNARRLLPKVFSDFKPAELPATLRALRAQLTVKREAALLTLETALQNLYPERDANDVRELARSAAGPILKTDDVRAFASEVGDLFPAEFGDARPTVIAALFLQEQKAKFG